jgi:hypothetical protein
MTRENLTKHRIYHCEERKMRCSTCKALVPYHLDLVSPHTRLWLTLDAQAQGPSSSMRMSRYVLPYMISRELIIGNPQNGAHRWSCAEAEVPCDHAGKGCPALIKRSDLKQHLTSCLFEQIAPYMNTIQEEIEGMKKDREKKSKQIDGLLRAQARLNGQLADLRPLSALTAAARRDADPRPSAAELDSDARMARAMEVVRRRRQAQLNAQPIPENIPERPPITPQTPAQVHAMHRPTVDSMMAAIRAPMEVEMAQDDATFRLELRRRTGRAEIPASAPTSITEDVANLPIARPRRTRSRLPPRDPDSDIQPPSTASMPSSSEVSETMATQGSIASSSSPTDTADAESSDPSDLAATINSTSGRSSRQSTNEIAITGNVARLDTSVSSSVVPGDSISNFRLPASADNRAGAITSHGFDGPSRLSEARRNEVEILATSLNLSRDSITTNYHVALDAPGTTRATAIEIDSDPEDDLDSILDMPMFRPGAFGDMHRAVSQLVERADRMERALEA